MFNSYYWHAAPLDDPELERAREALNGDDRAAAARGFARLLASPGLAARCTALDHFHRAEAWTRHGGGNPYEPQRDEVRRTARSVLAGAAVSRAVAGADIDGANHASALGAMINLAEPADAARLAELLADHANETVLELVLLCARSVLDQEPAHPGLLPALRRLVDDLGAPPDLRGQALGLLGLIDRELALELAAGLVRDREVRLQAYAALVLADEDLERRRALLLEVVAAWPDDAPYPASEVRQLLGD